MTTDASSTADRTFRVPSPTAGLARLFVGLLFAGCSMLLPAGCGGEAQVESDDEFASTGGDTGEELTAGGAPVLGWVSSALQHDTNARAYVTGWACRRSQSRPIAVSLYASGTLLGSVLADDPAYSADDAAAIRGKCATTASGFRFRILLSRRSRLEHFGEELTVRVAGQILPGTHHRMPGLNPSASMDIPQVWFGPLAPSRPSGTHGYAGNDFFNLFPSQGHAVPWSKSLSRLTAFQLFGGWLDDVRADGTVNNPMAATDAELDRVIDFLREHGVALAVELPALQDPALHVPSPSECALKGLNAPYGIHRVKRLQKIIGQVNARAGNSALADLDYLTLDEPFTHAAIAASGCLSIDETARHVAYTVKQMQSYFPSARIGLVEWVHVYTQTGISAQTFISVLEAYRRAVGKYPAHLHLDMDHPPSADQWALEVQVARDVQTYCRSHGIKFGIIYNSEASTNAGWTSGALSIAKSYESAGHLPSHAIFESWFDHPTTYVPESTSNTFTNLIAQYLHWKGALP